MLKKRKYRKTEKIHEFALDFSREDFKLLQNIAQSKNLTVDAYCEEEIIKHLNSLDWLSGSSEN